jgi:hypothetical protein
MVTSAYNASYLGGRGRRIAVSKAILGEKHNTLSEKINQNTKGWGHGSTGSVCLASMRQSIPNTAKKRKEIDKINN